MAKNKTGVIHPLLKRILDNKREEVHHTRSVVPLYDMKKKAEDADKPRPFAGGILAAKAKRKVIAEIKRISPGNAQLRKDFDPAAIGKGYEANGAAAVSVLTDTVFFGGSLGILAQVKDAVSIPVLRKDFIIEPYQIYEARAWGADAVLLMAVNFASKEEFQEMIGLAQETGIEPLLEIHNAEEAAWLPAGRHAVGINNRDFKDPDLKVDTGTAKKIAPLVKNARLLVSESGITSGYMMDELMGQGIDAFLIGNALMRDADPGAALAHLLK
ncbi:MAG: indole-3-glycerol-phosphate synthase [Nitrospinae bacterium]|nr:indole-3-glycerol-phosphate synthase [Nitrospinota bacterium]